MTRLQVSLRLNARRCLRLVDILLVDGGLVLGRDVGSLLGGGFGIHVCWRCPNLELMQGDDNSETGAATTGRKCPFYDGLRSPRPVSRPGTSQSTAVHYLLRGCNPPRTVEIAMGFSVTNLDEFASARHLAEHRPGYRGAREMSGATKRRAKHGLTPMSVAAHQSENAEATLGGNQAVIRCARRV